MLERLLRQRLEEKDLLVMAHLVAGYPSFPEGLRLIEAMVAAGVDMVEIQIPFSEPLADGPVIAAANQKALERGATVGQCLDFAAEAAQAFDIPFLVMTYYNIPYRYGLEAFAEALRTRGLKGAILPDLPVEEGSACFGALRRRGLSPIVLFSPLTSPERMRTLAGAADGFVYCVARKGVTGAVTCFDNGLAAYLTRCREATRLPLAVGFGLKDREDIGFLRGRAEIAVVGSELMRCMERGGPEDARRFLEELR
ncbi:Tryptophan synthase alpha chain [uncultured Desulfatiglans sp.]|uniref:Tryptophan synthase alpha chain n=1 Tax=Uncultured Desulfatiglans sp. TaxID=1748965 RepID=A0A653AI82_UNCDX|nr:Tryptophan synthase alpha chain [uncultured Desulfatiglans sp.]